MGGHILFVEFLFQPQQESDQFSGGYYGYPQGYYPYGCLTPQNPAIYTYTTISKVSKLPTAASIAASTITVGVKMTREDLLQTAPNVVGAASLENNATYESVYCTTTPCPKPHLHVQIL
ncbi:hypothetical protein SORBI_3003G126900 [Sorghum bicolor]|uniref:Uncharacterized protein n=1 Tax=Sorghum bicolor TaxID=4558 RepID=C5XGL4_SORBI|nr:hypothetical protein SORBI_3003G126900 [Sorghum bicolor]